MYDFEKSKKTGEFIEEIRKLHVSVIFTLLRMDFCNYLKTHKMQLLEMNIWMVEVESLTVWTGWTVWTG